MFVLQIWCFTNGNGDGKFTVLLIKQEHSVLQFEDAAAKMKSFAGLLCNYGCLIVKAGN